MIQGISSLRSSLAQLVSHLLLTSLTYTVNRRFLLILSNDIEANPGPWDKKVCPCGESARDLHIKCGTCNQKWHIKCVGLEEVESGLIKKVKSWKCPICYVMPDNIKNNLKDVLPSVEESGPILDEDNPMKSIYEKLVEMETKIQNIDNKVESNLIQRPEKSKNLYSTVASAVASVQNRSARPENQTQRNERSLIVKRYMDKNVRNSSDIRRQVSNEFSEAAIRNARTTAAGSILLEFEDVETADRVKRNWKPTLFGGNKGVVKLREEQVAGIIKHVYQDISEEDLIATVESQFVNSEVELFKRDQKFTGSIKVTFNSEDDLKAAMEGAVVINRHRYIMEKFNHQPRLIRCFNCHKLGHVARLCFMEGTICGKCCSREHKTKDCKVNPSQYKCFLCDGNHETGSKRCEIIKLKTEELKSARWR